MDLERCLAFSLLVAGLFCTGGATPDDEVQLPDGFKVCSPNDPSFDTCLLDAVEKDRIILENGYPQFDISPLNPVVISGLRLNVSQKFEFEMYQNDLIVDYVFDKFLKVSLDQDQKFLYMEALFDVIYARGTHDTTITSNVTSIEGTGLIYNIFDEVTATIHMPYSLYEKDGKVYMRCDRMDLTLTPQDMDIEIDGLEPETAEAVTDIMKSNWKRFYGPVLPDMARQLGTVFTAYLEGLFRHVPYKTLFPD